MNCLRRSVVRRNILKVASLLTVVAVAYGYGQSTVGQLKAKSAVGNQGPLSAHEVFSPAAVASGSSSFQQNCAFCHGKEASGGESGPDLTRSKLVSSDTKGENIGAVIRNGRPDKGMPRFSLSDGEITNLVAFIHSQQDKTMSQTGDRKGVDESDLQTGNIEAGKRYFNGAGRCATCHSATGDLAGVGSRYQELKLEEQMLYPKNIPSNVIVTTAGKVLSGQLAYLDEFVVAMIDSTGTYRSWPIIKVKYEVVAPVNAHIDLLSKYTDDDVHNLFAYMQSLH